MAGLVQAQPTQCLSLPSSIRSPVDRRGLERLAALIPEDKSVRVRCKFLAFGAIAPSFGSQDSATRIAPAARSTADQRRARSSP